MERKAASSTAFDRVYGSDAPAISDVLLLAEQDARHAEHTEWANKLSDARSRIAELVALVRQIDDECGNAKPDFGRVVKLALEAAALARTSAEVSA